MHIPLIFLLLVSTFLSCMTAYDTKKSHTDTLHAVPATYKRQQGLINSHQKDKLLQVLDEEINAQMAIHKSTMTSHLASLAESLGMDLKLEIEEDLGDLLGAMLSVLNEVESDETSTFKHSQTGKDRNRGGKEKVQGGSLSEKFDKKPAQKGDQEDVKQKMGKFVNAMGIIEEMKELHLSLNLWLVDIESKIGALKDGEL